jgi:methyl-accepting chemotaxis protein
MAAEKKSTTILFGNQRITTKLFWLISFMISILLLVGAVGMGMTMYMNSQAIHLMNQVDTARQAQVNFKIQIQEWKNTLLRGQNQENFNKYKESFVRSGKDVQDLLDKLKSQLAAGDSAIADIDVLKKVLINLQAKYLEELAGYETGNISSSEKVDRAVKGLDRGPTEDMDKIVAKISHSSNAQLDRLNLFSISVTASILILGIAGGLVLSLLISRSISHPLRMMTERVIDLSEGDGDLTRRVGLDSKDELGFMARKIDQFLAQIHEIVTVISGNSQNISHSAEQLAETSESMASSSEQLLAQSQSIAAATTQMNKNLQVVSAAVEEMTVSVQEVAKKAAEGSGVTNGANRSAVAINGEVKKLGENAREIGGVIESIVSIASQTNLLALNASIEAAGAGAAGRGFAVVASEVKELARQAGESSGTIRERIEGIQKGVGSTITAIEDVTAVIQNVNEINMSIASAVEEQSITSRELANNISQVSIASGEIARNIAGVSEATKATSRDAAATSKEAVALRGLSDELKKIVNRFRI